MSENKLLRISYNDAWMFKNCAHAYKLVKFDRVKREFRYSEGGFLGTVFHDTIESWLIGGDWMSKFEEKIAYCIGKWGDKEIPLESLRSRAMYALEASINYATEHNWKERVYRIEVPILRNIDNIDVVGRPDLILHGDSGTLDLLDFKFVFVTARQDVTQLGWYNYIYNGPIDNVNLTTAGFMCVKGKEMAFQMVDVAKSTLDAEALVKKVSSGVRKGRFPKTHTWWCKTICPARDACISLPDVRMNLTPIGEEFGPRDSSSSTIVT